MVEVDLNGRLDVLAVRVTPEMLNPNDKDVLESLIAAAFTNAVEKIKESIGSEIGGVAGIPPSFFSGIL
jgi:DNA-binding protein YbaB